MSEPVTPEHWTADEHSLSREWPVRDFSEAVIFAAAIAQIANKANHHPDLTVEYGRVVARITTHEAGRTLTDKDYDLAERLNSL